MRSAIIIVLYKTPVKEIERLKNEVKDLNLKNYKLIFIDNSYDNKGFAYGLNKGIKKAKSYNPDFYIFTNPDISLRNLKNKNLFIASSVFDIWGFAFKQDNKTYYGGKIDKLRLSGGLITKKPNKRLVSCNFVSGSLIFVKKEVIKEIGLFNEKYFMYYEDLEYCYRAKKQGFKIGIDSYINYIHYEISKQNDLKDYLLDSSRRLFLKKYGSFKQKIYEIIRLPKTIIENKQSFLFNFLSLNISSISIRLVNFVLFLIYIRFLTVKDFGIYSLVWTHINLLAPFADFGTTTYGITRKKIQNKFISNLYSLRLLLSIITVIFTVFLGFLIGFNSFIIFLVIIGSPVIISNAISGTYLIIQSLKNKQYITSIVSIGFSLISLTVLGIVTYMTKSLINIFIGILSLYFIYVLINICLIKKEIKIFAIFNLKKWMLILRKSFVFVLITLFSGIYFKIDVYLLNFLKSLKEVAIYTAGYRFFEAFLFISASYSFSILPTLTKLYNYNKTLFLNKIKKDSFFLGFFGVIISLICVLVSKNVFDYFLTLKYLESVKVFNIVILSLPMILITTVFFNSLYVINKSKIVLLIFIFQSFINLFLNYFYIPKYSYIASSYITLISEFINLLLVILLFYKNFKYENRN